MMHLPEQHAEMYRGHTIRISAADAADAPHRYAPRIEWVEQVDTPRHVFYKLTPDESTFSDPLAAVTYGVNLVKRWVDRMQSNAAV